jgi:hypothetical protein
MTEREVVLVVQPIERMRLLENAVRPRERVHYCMTERKDSVSQREDAV